METAFSVMGVAFRDRDVQAACRELRAALSGPRGQMAVFANAATLNLAARDPEYRVVLNGAAFVYGDGLGVRLAARLRGRRLRANLNGTDLVPTLIRTTPGVRVFLLGGAETTVRAAAASFPLLFPQAVLAGAHHGYFDPADHARLLALINDAAPDLLLVGLGNPLQERFIFRHRHGLRVPLAAGVGGLFHYWAGTLDRAPDRWRRLGLEWLHIMRRQPHKCRRYLIGNPLFLVRMICWLRADGRAARASAVEAGIAHPIVNSIELRP